MPDHNYFANIIWQIADLLRGPVPRWHRANPVGFARLIGGLGDTNNLFPLSDSQQRECAPEATHFVHPVP